MFLSYARLVQRTIAYDTFMFGNMAKSRLARLWATYWAAERGAGFMQRLGQEVLDPQDLRRRLGSIQAELYRFHEEKGRQEHLVPFPLDGMLWRLNQLRTTSLALASALLQSSNLDNESNLDGHPVFEPFVCALESCIAVYPYTFYEADPSVHGSGSPEMLIRLWLPTDEKGQIAGGLFLPWLKEQASSKESPDVCTEHAEDATHSDYDSDRLGILKRWGDSRIESLSDEEAVTLNHGIGGRREGIVLSSLDIGTVARHARENLAAGYLNDVRVLCKPPNGDSQEIAWGIVCLATIIPSFFERAFAEGYKVFTQRNESRQSLGCIDGSELDNALRTHLSIPTSAYGQVLRKLRASHCNAEFHNQASTLALVAKSPEDQTALRDLLYLWAGPKFCVDKAHLKRALQQAQHSWQLLRQVRSHMMGHLAHELEPPMANISFAVDAIRRNPDKADPWLGSIEDQVASIDSLSDLFLWQRLRHPDDYARESDLGAELSMAIRRACRHAALVSASRRLRSLLSHVQGLAHLLDHRTDLIHLFESAFALSTGPALANQRPLRTYWHFLRSSLHVFLHNALLHGLEISRDVQHQVFTPAYVKVHSEASSISNSQGLVISVVNTCMKPDIDRIRRLLEDPFPDSPEMLPDVHCHGLSAAIAYQVAQWSLHCRSSDTLEQMLDEMTTSLTGDAEGWSCRVYYGPHLALAVRTAPADTGHTGVVFELHPPLVTGGNGEGG